MIVHQLFPQPVYFSKLERSLTKEESKMINKHKKKTYKNSGNSVSWEHSVLDHKLLKNLMGSSNIEEERILHMKFIKQIYAIRQLELYGSSTNRLFWINWRKM